MGILAFLFKYRTVIMYGLAALAIIAAIFGFIHHLNSLHKQIDELTHERDNLKIELRISQESVKSLQTSIDLQNDAIDKLKKDADQRVDAHKEEIKKAKVVSDGYKKQAQDLMKQKPAATATDCQASEQLIDQEIEKEHSVVVDTTIGES